MNISMNAPLDAAMTARISAAMTPAAAARRVTVLLSTYNGVRYLAEQLASLRAQSYDNWRLVWRDDGSSDATVAMMRDFTAAMGPERCVELQDSGPHYGAAESFLKLLHKAAAEPFIAFADQDDVWLPDKLQNAVMQIEAAGAGPVLYCARQFLVNHALRNHRLSAAHRPTGFPACLTQNIANGNTVVMNRQAACLVASIKAPAATVHDWWSYIVVSACGGRVIYDPEPVVLYRQHLKNLVGAQLPTVTRAIAALERGPQIYMTMMRRHAERLHACRDRLTAAAQNDLDLIRGGLAGGFSERLAALRCPGFKRATGLENLLFRIWFLTQIKPRDAQRS
jgi:glycosyltransferase involved in cell wall biosynthesis